MALNAAVVVEVRTDGADTNGGGFKTGASGTDYSQQAAAQYALTGLTTAAANAIILTASAAANMVGNLIQITSGTNFTVGFYEITSVSVGVSITVDRNCTTAAGAAGVGNIGGALLTIQAGINVCTVDSMTCYVKAGSGYTITSALTFSARAGSYITQLIGYTTTRGDAVKPVITISGNIDGMTPNAGWVISNFTIDGAGSSGIGINTTNNLCSVYNCWVKNFAGGGISLPNTGNGITGCEVSGCGGVGISGNPGNVRYCYVHDNTGTVGIQSQSTFGCIVESNSGVGIKILSYPANASNNTVYNNSGNGIVLQNAFDPSIAIIDLRNNLLVSNGAYGIADSGVAVARNRPWIRNNAFKSNTSGTYDASFISDSSNVTLTADPFVDGPNGNFALNNTAGGGAACRGAGYPGIFPGGLSTGYIDIGAIQHQDAGGGAMVPTEVWGVESVEIGA